MPTPVHPYSDYGIALRTLRSARSWLGLLLFACIVFQFIGFALMYWTQQPYWSGKQERTWIDEGRDRLQKNSARAHPATTSSGGALEAGAATTPRTPATAAAATVPATEPAEDFFPSTPASRDLKVRPQWNKTYTMLVPLTQILALISIASQVIIIFITLLVILVAQAPGVAQITRSLIWSVLLLFMVLPWQYFARDFPIPGVIYGYHELLDQIHPHVVGVRTARFQEVLVYLRFVFWPLLGLLAQLIMSERFRGGIMLAIGHPLQSILQSRPKPAAAILPPGMGNPEKPRG